MAHYAADSALAKFSAARALLADCKTVMQAKEIADVADAARVYLERTNASTAVVNQATEVRLLAERQMGEFLKTMPKAKGALREGPEIPVVTVSNHGKPVTLSEIGITKRQSRVAQKLADIPAKEFTERLAVAKASGGKLSTAKVLETAKPPPSAPPAGPADSHGHRVMRAIMAEVDRIRKQGVVVTKDMSAEIGAVVINRMTRPMEATAESIYDAYPRHEGRGAALLKIKVALGKVPADELLYIVQAYAMAVSKWPGDERQYIPHPATWFHQERWTDDPKMWERGTPAKAAPGREDYSKF